MNKALNFFNGIVAPADAQKSYQAQTQHGAAANSRPGYLEQAVADLWTPGRLSVAAMQFTQVRPFEAALSSRCQVSCVARLRCTVGAVAAVLGAAAGAGLRVLTLCAATLVAGVAWAVIHAIILALKTDAEKNQMSLSSKGAADKHALTTDEQVKASAVTSLSPAVIPGEKVNSAVVPKNVELFPIEQKSTGFVHHDQDDATIDDIDPNMSLLPSSLRRPKFLMSQSLLSFVVVDACSSDSTRAFAQKMPFGPACFSLHNSEQDIAHVFAPQDSLGPADQNHANLSAYPSPRGTFSPGSEPVWAD